MTRITFIHLVWFAAAATLQAQDTASLSVTITDPSSAVVPGARVVIVDSRRGTVRQGTTSAVGIAHFDALSPSDYAVEASMAGFDTLRVTRVTLAIRDRQLLRLEFKVKAAAATSVTVTEEAEGLTTDSARAISLDQQYIQNLPVNGRNAESLILMAPGVTSASGGRGGGGFNANGLRANANYYTLDGVSLNSSVGGGAAGGGPGPGGASPASFGSGTSTEMISIDAMQEMRVQTSAFAPEFGRSPGAQVSMTSRGGTNQFHGSLFYYWRNDRLNANDWFANSTGLPRGELRQNRPGGTFGGPLVRNKTFFFVSYEGVRLQTPATLLANVPSNATRQAASRTLRPYLNAFPIANGPVLDDGAAQFRSLVSNPSSSDSASLRIDHGLTKKIALFGRYSLTPSDSQSRGSDIISPNVVTRRDGRSHTATSGMTYTLSPTLLNDLRVNYSQSDSRGTSTMDTFGGAVPLTDALVFPAGITSATGEFSLNIPGVAGYSYFSRSRTAQKQVNVVNSLSKTTPEHSLKWGVDYRRIMPTNYHAPYSSSAVFSGLTGDDGALLTGIATNAQVSNNTPAVYPVYLNLSTYAQDTWRATERTTLTYGLRWDINPAPSTRKGEKPFALAESEVAGVTQNEPLYETRWLDLAPRVGLAYQIDTTQGREMMFRAGFGLFYDLGYGVTAGAFNGAPYSSVRTISSATFPLTAADAAPPTLPPTRPYGQVTSAENTLKSPVVFQWNSTVERSFGRGQLLSVGYVGTSGRRLMRTETRPSFSQAYDLLRTATNGSTSDYHGLQVQFRRRLSARLQTQVSYTYAHSLDSSSNDAGFGGGFATLFGAGQRGSSDYDIRHNLNFSGTYLLPLPQRGWLGAVVGGWYSDWVATWRTGLPFDVQGISTSTSATTTTPRGLFAQVRPDYNGKPVWIEDPNAPGGHRLNAAAFTSPSGYEQGNLGRNALRGFGTSQLDLALRRQVAMGDRWRLNLSAQAYNVANHPNFANPSPLEGSNMSSPNFGIVTRMLNQGSGAGVNSLYRSGGPRSLELSLRLQF